MSAKNDLTSLWAAFTPFANPQPADMQSYLSITNSMKEFDWVAWTAYKNAATVEERAKVAATIQQFVNEAKRALKVDGCPPGYHPEGDRCVPDNIVRP